MDIFSNDFANLANFLNVYWLIRRYQFACKKHSALKLKDIAFLSGLNYCYLSKVCNKHAGISLDRFKAIYLVLYNDLLINGELKSCPVVFLK